MAPAEEVAIDILAWLAQEPEYLGRFLALTGADPGSVRSAAQDPAFLAGLVEFLMGHEPTLMEFCKATGTAPVAVVRAHHALSGDADGGY